MKFTSLLSMAARVSRIRVVELLRLRGLKANPEKKASPYLKGVVSWSNAYNNFGKLLSSRVRVSLEIGLRSYLKFHGYGSERT